MHAPLIVDSPDLWKKIQDTRFVLLTTMADDNSLETRPMTIQRIEEPGTLLFFASQVSPLVQGLRSRPGVNIGVANLDDDFFVSITGHATVTSDRELISELWSPLAKAWFPGGVEDEDLVVIEVEAAQAEYWNVNDGEMVQFFKIARAAVTGKPPVDLGEHGTMTFGERPVRLPVPMR